MAAPEVLESMGLTVAMVRMAQKEEPGRLDIAARTLRCKSPQG
jgi:hypothetical protein